MKRSGFTLIETLVVIAIIGVLIGLTLPAVLRVRDASHRTRCAAQLRQLGMAMHAYHSANNRFPPGSHDRRNQQRHLSWIAHILPHLERVDLWTRSQEAFQFDRSPFHNPPHTPLDTMIPIIICPSDPRSLTPRTTIRGFPVAFTCYLGVSSDESNTERGILYGGSKVAAHDVIDGLSNTLMIGERPPSNDFVLGWWYAGTGTNGRGYADHYLAIGYPSSSRPAGFRPGNVNLASDLEHFWSLHIGGSHFLFADGSTHFLSYSAAKILPTLATRAGGEAVTLPE